MHYSFDDLLPHVRPLEPLLADPDITEIMVNGGGIVFTERGGRLYQEPIVLKTQGVRDAIAVIARMNDQEPGDAHPLLNARLSDGSRVSAVLSPQSPDGDVMAIRKFGRRYSLEQLVEGGSITPTIAAILRQAVLDQWNILIAGGTGTGKTTMVNALADTIPAKERILLIESTSEIFLDMKRHPNVVRFEARVAQDRPDMAWPAIEISDLLRMALRFSPDRIIVGEVRGSESWDLIQALNTGHRGSMSTTHSNSAEEALVRLAEMVSQHDPPNRAVARSIDLVVQIERNRETGHRQVTEVAKVDRYDPGQDRFILTPVQ